MPQSVGLKYIGSNALKYVLLLGLLLITPSPVDGYIAILVGSAFVIIGLMTALASVLFLTIPNKSGFTYNILMKQIGSYGPEFSKYMVNRNVRTRALWVRSLIVLLSSGVAMVTMPSHSVLWVGLFMWSCGRFVFYTLIEENILKYHGDEIRYSARVYEDSQIAANDGGEN